MSELSLLNDVKKVIGINSDYDIFDADLIMHINTCIETLRQLGIQPLNDFVLTNNTQTWAEYYPNINKIPAIKTYIYQKVKLIFDPPTSQFLLDALKQNLLELEWRINSEVDWGGPLQ